MNNLPAERMQPEAMEVVEAYLRNDRDVNRTAEDLSTTPTVISDLINKREVRSYLDHLFMESGYRNREKFFDILDNVLEAKMEELDEAQMSSSMDIMDILKIYHGMKIKELELSIKLQELQQGSKGQNAKTINNLQINNSSGYDNLLSRIISGDKKK